MYSIYIYIYIYIIVLFPDLQTRPRRDPTSRKLAARRRLDLDHVPCIGSGKDRYLHRRGRGEGLARVESSMQTLIYIYAIQEDVLDSCSTCAVHD